MTRVTPFWLPFPALAVSLVALTGCPKKEPPHPPEEDAAPAPPPSTTVTELAPLVEEAGTEDAAAEAGPKKYVGPAMNQNQVRIEACCNAMRAQAKALGASSPEAFQINAMATQCDLVAKQVGPAGTAPEFAQLRAMLKSIKLPSACNF